MTKLRVTASTVTMVTVVAAVLFGAPAAAQPAAAQPLAGPIVRENTTVKVAAHTYAIPDNRVGGVPNVGIIVGSRGTLVIDTGLGRRNGETVLRETQKVSKNSELYLATTHVHPEHDLGAGAFPATTKMIRSRDQDKDIAEFGAQSLQTFTSRSALNAELLKDAEYRKADISFENEYLLDLGGVRVRMLAVGPTHTRGDTAFYVEGDNVLFSGDVAMPNLPAFASPYASVRAWITAVERFAALKPSRVVPSHGDMGDASMIALYRDFLQTVQRRAAELKKQGKSADEAATTVTEELRTKYANQQPARIAPAVRAAYAEAQ